VERSGRHDTGWGRIRELDIFSLSRFDIDTDNRKGDINAHDTKPTVSSNLET